MLCNGCARRKRPHSGSKVALTSVSLPNAHPKQPAMKITLPLPSLSMHPRSPIQSGPVVQSAASPLPPPPQPFTRRRSRLQKTPRRRRRDRCRRLSWAPLDRVARTGAIPQPRAGRPCRVLGPSRFPCPCQCSLCRPVPRPRPSTSPRRPRRRRCTRGRWESPRSGVGTTQPEHFDGRSTSSSA